MEARVRGALSQATELQAEMEELKEDHAAELYAAQQQLSMLQKDLQKQHEHCMGLSQQLDDAEQAVAR